MTVSSRADAAVLEFYDGATLKRTLTVSKAGPYTLTNAMLVGLLDSERTFAFRACLVLDGYRSTDTDSITITVLRVPSPFPD